MVEFPCNQYLDNTVVGYPNKKAVTDGNSFLTFQELADVSNHLGSLLVELGIKQGDRVLYYLKRSIDCITATVGILKSGAAYVPLDQKTPVARWEQIIIDAAPRAIICNSITLQDTLIRASKLDIHPDIICLDSGKDYTTRNTNIYFSEDIERASTSLPSTGSPDDIAYVLYTSGSTGVPKGVMVTHGNIRNYIDWAINFFNITSHDRILGTAPFHFDMSTFDIFCFMATGATLCLATDTLLLFPEKLVQYIEQEQVTIWKGVSSLLMYMCRARVLYPGRMPTLRTVIFAGESLDPQYLIKWKTTFPEISFYNGYGPTEATGVSVCYYVDHIPELGQPIPIGVPCKGAQVVVVGDDGIPVGPNEIGELLISGPCLAKGYLNDIEKTKKYFTPPPPGFDHLGDIVYHTGDLVRQNDDGNYVFVSRKDLQVKWMGYRIELNEIEMNIMAYPDIRCAIVFLAKKTQDGLEELVALYEADKNIEPSTILKFLGRRLPGYMIPKSYLRLNEIPRNDRGKIDRKEIMDVYARIVTESNDKPLKSSISF